MDHCFNNRVSIVIVYNNLEKLNEAKLWIERQTIFDDIELVALDNRQKRFSSAAKALNYGAEYSFGDVLIFMHQDIYLWDLEAVEKYRAYLQKNPEQIIGVAGVTPDKDLITDIYETEAKLQREYRAKGQIIEVESLDECMFAMHRNVWECYRFDEVCCDNWHSYALDICLAHRLAGGRNMVVPLQVLHASLGDTQNNSFRSTAGNLVRKYRHSGIQRIHSCCLKIGCNLRSYYWYRCKEAIKDILRTCGLRK